MMESEELTRTEAEMRFDQRQIKQEQAEAKEYRENQQKRDKETQELQAVHAEYSASTVKFLRFLIPQIGNHVRGCSDIFLLSQIPPQ